MALHRRLFFRSRCFALEAGRDYRLKEGHHGAKFGAESLDGVLLLALTHSQEVRAALFIFIDPRLSETAIADFRENLAHLLARLLGDDARSGRIIALFGSVTDGVAHVAEAAAVNQINNELKLVKAFEVGNLRLVAGFRESFEARFDQFTYTAAKYGLLAEEVGFSFFGESRFENAGACAAEGLGVSEGKRLRGTAGILLDGEERGCSATFGEDFANAMARGFWSDHGDIDGGRGFDGAETDVEAVREHQSLHGLEIWLNGVAIQLGLLGVRNENHDNVGPGSGFRGSVDRQAGVFRFGA